MKHLNLKFAAAAALTLGLGSAAMAQTFMTSKSEVETLLSGATFVGIYLRTETAYVLQFGTDGHLTDSTGAKARWWVSDKGEYCREWLDGRLAGNKGCMGVVLEDGQLSLHSDGKKVAEGVLSRK